MSSCLFNASQVGLSPDRDLACIALLQIDVPLQTVVHKLLYTAIMGPASRLLSLQVHGKVTYHMTCIHHLPAYLPT